MKKSRNKKLLDELNRSHSWFRAKKKRSVWAKRISDSDPTEIETLEGTMSANVGDYLCRGTDGEFWPQDANQFRERYDSTKVIDADGFRLFRPNRTDPGVVAAKVKRSFSVQTNYGRMKGKVGDYLVKPFADHETDYPESVWVVDARIFRSTYGRIPTKTQSRK